MKMKWTLRAFALVALMFTVKFIKGEVKLAIDCIDAGREGIVSEIKCKIAGSKTSTFVLIRPDGKLVSKCLQTSVSRTCTIPSGLDKIYRSQLITSNEASVLIMSFNSKVDAGVWTCKAEPQHVHSTCNKTSGPASTLIDCMDVGFKQQKTELKCTIAGLVLDGIVWKNPLGYEVATGDPLNKKYDIHDDMCKVVIDSYSRHRLIIKSFIPKLHAGKWTCADGRQGRASSCVKQRGMLATIAGTTPYAVRGRQFIFVCIVDFAVNMVDKVSFYRKSITGAFLSLYQKEKNCMPVHEMKRKGYGVLCDQNTNKQWSDTKLYVLKITSPGDRDAEDWWCQLRDHKAHNTIFKLAVYVISLSLTGSSVRIVRGMEFVLTCVVKNVADLESAVKFCRLSKPNVCAVISQKDSRCKLISDGGLGYDIQCGNGTDSSLSDWKTYTLTIKRLTVNHSSSWWCQLDSDSQHSNIFKLQVQGFSPTLNGSAQYAEMDQTFVLVCSVENAVNMNDEVLFFKQSAMFASLRQTKHQCSSSVSPSGGYQVLCGEGTNILASNIKHYLLTIDQLAAADGGEWTCQVNTDGTPSAMVITLTADGSFTDLFVLAPMGITAAVVSGLVVITFIVLCVFSCRSQILTKKYNKSKPKESVGCRLENAAGNENTSFNCAEPRVCVH